LKRNLCIGGKRGENELGGFELDRRSYFKGVIEKWLTPCNTEGGYYRLCVGVWFCFRGYWYFRC